MTEFSNLGVLQTHKTNVCFNFYQDQILKIFEYHSIFIKALESAGKGQPARFFFLLFCSFSALLLTFKIRQGDAFN